MILGRFADVRPRGNEIAVWRVGDAEHVPRKRVPRYLPCALQLPHTHRSSPHARQKTAVRRYRHADVRPQVWRGNPPSRTVAPTPYLRASASVVHHELSIGEVVGNNVVSVLGPLERMRSVLDLERRSASRQFPYLNANATCREPRVVRGESCASGVPLARFEHGDAAAVGDVAYLQTVRHVLPLDRIRQQAGIVAEMDDAETAADGRFVERVLDLACVGVPEQDLTAISVRAACSELFAVGRDGDGGEVGEETAADSFALAGLLFDVPDL